jgi:hypothetical protein
MPHLSPDWLEQRWSLYSIFFQAENRTDEQFGQHNQLDPFRGGIQMRENGVVSFREAFAAGLAA